MIPSLVALVAVTLACALTVRECFKLVTLERRHMAEERASWTVERAGLLQRIQAPAVAAADHSLHLAIPVPVPPVAMDDDTGMWASQGIDVSKEDLAEFAYQQEMA